MRRKDWKLMYHSVSHYLLPSGNIKNSLSVECQEWIIWNKNNGFCYICIHFEAAIYYFCIANNFNLQLRTFTYVLYQTFSILQTFNWIICNRRVCILFWTIIPISPNYVGVKRWGQWCLERLQKNKLLQFRSEQVTTFLLWLSNA